jgi:hypothetical protein
MGFYLYLAAALVTIRQLIQRARHRYRWDNRPTTKRLKWVGPPAHGRAACSAQSTRRSEGRSVEPK